MTTASIRASLTPTLGLALALAVSTVAFVLAANASAQETDPQARARAATQSLNGGPAPVTAPRPRPQPTTTRPMPSDVDRSLEALLGRLEAPEEAGRPPVVTLAPGERAPTPIPVALGYYVRGEIDCDQVWPGEGNLAFMTPTAFTIDFGGCEPGQFLQTGVNSWRERQRCQTELGGDAGAYVVDYEMIETGVLSRSARLQIDDSVEVDTWRFCERPEVPENARFGS